MKLLAVLLCTILLILPALICVLETKHQQTEGIKHVIAAMVHKKMKRYFPKLIKSIHVVSVPMLLHNTGSNKKGFVVQAAKLPNHLPPVSPCNNAHHWHHKDLNGSGCEHHFG